MPTRIPNRYDVDPTGKAIGVNEFVHSDTQYRSNIIVRHIDGTLYKQYYGCDLRSILAQLWCQYSIDRIPVMVEDNTGYKETIRSQAS